LCLCVCCKGGNAEPWDHGLCVCVVRGQHWALSHIWCMSWCLRMEAGGHLPKLKKVFRLFAPFKKRRWY
jgi:hypothetical protein